MNVEDLIDSILEGQSPEDVLSEAYTRAQASARRPRKRLYGKKGDAYDPYTGKRKDPRKRLAMRKVARRFRSKMKAAHRKSARRLKATGFYKKLGRLVARIRR